jgi:hypothetical protein
LIKSVVHNDTEAIQAILDLHCKGQQIDLDATYSRGNFYKKGLPKPRFCSDIEPKEDGVIPADAMYLPFKDKSLGIIIFDPPFLATTGPSLKKDDDSNKLNKRFGVYPNETLLFDFYEKAIKEFYRVCKKKGILIFKCQDKVSSGIQYFSHCFIYNKAIEAGWYPKDLFVKLAEFRIVADWQKKNQKHARKHHCFYWVFLKR